MGQVNAGRLDQFFGVEEDVVVAAAVGVGRVANERQFRLVNGFRGVHDAVAVVVVLTGTVFVVVVPLSEDQTGVVGTVLGIIDRHDGVVAWVHVAVLVNGVERVSIIFEVEGDKVAAHAGQINVGDGERFVGPRVVIAERTRITRVAEPVGVVVEDLRRAAVLVVDGTLWLLIFLISVALGAAFEGFFANGGWCTTVNVGGCS